MAWPPLEATFVSEKALGLFEFGCDDDEFDFAKRLKVFVRGNRRIFQPPPTAANTFQKGVLVKAALMNEKRIGMLDLDTVRLKGRRRKVFEIVGDDDACLSGNRCGENVPVVLVGERERRDQMSVPVNQAIGQGGIHSLAPSLDPQRIEARAIAFQVAHPLVVNVFGPASPKNAGSRQFDDQIGDGHRVERRSVDQGCETWHDD